MPPLEDEILLELGKTKGKFVSGEALAKSLRVSRAAVWKAVRRLAGQGVVIEAVPRAGYRLHSAPDRLREQEIRAALAALGYEAQVCCYQTIDSTNTEARRKAPELAGPCIFAAEEQTQGRGRQGHSFYSPSGTGLYMTVSVPLSLRLDDAALATQAMAVAAMRAVRKAGGPELSVKWVNDLYIGQKKTAGILTEAITDLESGLVIQLLCGIGFNLTTESFPDELAGTAGSIGRLPRNRLAALTAAEFLGLVRTLPDTAGWMDDYRSACMVLGKGLSFTRDGQTCHAVAERIDDRGGLVVRMADSSLLTLTSGEISIRPDGLAK